MFWKGREGKKREQSRTQRGEVSDKRDMAQSISTPTPLKKTGRVRGGFTGLDLGLVRVLFRWRDLANCIVEVGTERGMNRGAN